VTRLKDEIKDIRRIMTNILDQNHLLMKLFKSRTASSDESHPTYIKNVPKPMTWDTRDKRNMETFLTEYKTYCNASGYIGDEVRVRNFGSFFKDGASIAFAAWHGSRGEDLL
jgi:hypothetical protein